MARKRHLKTAKKRLRSNRPRVDSDVIVQLPVAVEAVM
jgi:hypothetical protein